MERLLDSVQEGDDREQALVFAEVGMAALLVCRGWILCVHALACLRLSLASQEVLQACVLWPR